MLPYPDLQYQRTWLLIECFGIYEARSRAPPSAFHRFYPKYFTAELDLTQMIFLFEKIIMFMAMRDKVNWGKTLGRLSK